MRKRQRSFLRKLSLCNFLYITKVVVGEAAGLLPPLFMQKSKILQNFLQKAIPKNKNFGYNVGGR